MSDKSGIEWTTATWTPVKGCTRVSAGCDHCYAVGMTHRLEAMGQQKYAGLTVLNGRGDRHFNGKVVLDADALTVPLRWKKPRTIFVSSMSDIFHKDVPFDYLDRIFAVMALCPQHTFQVLTKRPERMAEYLNTSLRLEHIYDHWYEFSGSACEAEAWPLPNVWLGTSVESQRWADERIPHLLKCPAAVRFLSMEPLLGPVDLTALKLSPKREYVGKDPTIGNKPVATIAPIHGHAIKANVLASEVTTESGVVFKSGRGIDWVIVGGESGPKARPCDVAWIRSIVQQCKAAGVPCFVKQLGSRPYDGEVEFCRFRSYQEWVNKASSWLGGVNSAGQRYMPRMDAVCIDKVGRVCTIGGDFMRARDEDAFSVHCHEVMRLRDIKGGDMAEWPEDLRVREMPAVVA